MNKEYKYYLNSATKIITVVGTSTNSMAGNYITVEKTNGRIIDIPISSIIYREHL